MPRNVSGNQVEMEGGKTDKDIKRLRSIVPKVAEDAKIRLDQMLQDFLNHVELSNVTLPKQLSSMERAYVHYQANNRSGIASFSTGTGDDRRLTLRRTSENTSMDMKSVDLTQASLLGISGFMMNFPSCVQVNGSINQSDVGEKSANSSSRGVYPSRLCIGPRPKVPKPRKTDLFFNFRSRLPVWAHKEHILQAIESRRVIFIKGDTGCGKTTQVPQFILDDAMSKSKSVRIICTVPRRIAAVSVSERVATERGERLGQTVGYQIRLESCISPCETLLTYCTSGVLLRSMATPDYNVIRRTTHIIIDEVHERDRQTDFLLACLRDILSMFPNLHLILMGADLNNELFSTYFGGENECPIIQVEGRLHPVTVFYLEDVLEKLKYENYEMRSSGREQNEQEDVYKRLVAKFQVVESDVAAVASVTDFSQAAVVVEEKAFVKTEVDELIKRVWTTGDESALADYLHMVASREISVNYQHSTIGVTMLMAASARGLLDCVTKLIQIGADLSIKSKIGDSYFSAIDWASDHLQHDVLKYLLEHQYQTKLIPAVQSQTKNSAKLQRLASYLRSIDEERVDLLLVLRVLHQIHATSDYGHGVLVFLPGYDEIVTLKHLILTDNNLGFRRGTFTVFMLHSNIQTGDQRAAFESPPKGVRKIVLSTNIAETSLTIEDIVYVIDTGRAKEKSFDSMTSVTQLKSMWISKASVNQRRGRAGRCRPGICYHLFSSARYESMSEFPIPEIVRTSLQELCLYARSFIKSSVSIGHFFQRIPEPPAPIAVKKSVELLKVMGALDKEEKLTRLGMHLLDFPVEPFLGKALMYAVAFKCLDPILTLVSVISYRDPFQLPSDPKDKQNAQECKAKFSRKSYSDHMAYLKAFQDWEKSKMFSEGTERRFCRENYLSSVTFEMVYTIRSQLIGQLRASGFVQNKGPVDLRELNINSNNWALVKGVLVAALYPNVCGVDHKKNALFNSYCSKVAFHPSTTLTKKKSASTTSTKKKSGLEEIPTEWIVFDEMTQQGSSNLVKGCTCVSTAAVALFAGSFSDTPVVTEGVIMIKGSETNDEKRNLVRPPLNMKINNWITLKGRKNTVEALTFLRRKVSEVILKKLVSPQAPCSNEDTIAIQTIAAVLVSEDVALGFENIKGIGQWPKLVSGNLMSAPRTGFERPVGSVDVEAAVTTSNRHVRFFAMELADQSQLDNLMNNGVWLIPEIIQKKFSPKEATPSEVIVFFWCPTAKEFTGVMKVKDALQLEFLAEVPVEVLALEIITIQNIEHQIGFKTSCDLPMHGLELDRELGRAILACFLQAKNE